MTTKTQKIGVVLVSLALFACGCDGRSAQTSAATAPPATNPTAPNSAQVSIDNFSFSPKSLTVAPGTRVTWINRDDVPHTVTSSSSNHKPLSSHALDTDDKYSFVFTEKGTYDYFCAVHPHMTGGIIVK